MPTRQYSRPRRRPGRLRGKRLGPAAEEEEESAGALRSAGPGCAPPGTCSRRERAGRARRTRRRRKDGLMLPAGGRAQHPAESRQGEPGRPSPPPGDL